MDNPYTPPKSKNVVRKNKIIVILVTVSALITPTMIFGLMRLCIDPTGAELFLYGLSLALVVPSLMMHKMVYDPSQSSYSTTSHLTAFFVQMLIVMAAMFGPHFVVYLVRVFN